MDLDSWHVEEGPCARAKGAGIIQIRSVSGDEQAVSTEGVAGSDEGAEVTGTGRSVGKDQDRICGSAQT